jgi:hypothetical protein
MSSADPSHLFFTELKRLETDLAAKEKFQPGTEFSLSPLTGAKRF